MGTEIILQQTKKNMTRKIKNKISVSPCIIAMIIAMASCITNPQEILDEKIYELTIDNRLSEDECHELDSLFTAWNPSYGLSNTDPDSKKKNVTNNKIRYINELLGKELKSNYYEELIKEKPITLKTANIYIDNSSSMMGYYKANNANDFIDPIFKLMGLYPENKVTTNCYYFKDGGNNVTAFIQIEKDSLGQMISQKKLQESAGSPFGDIIKNIVNKSNAETISFFITDGIMSGTNQQIHSNSSYNKNCRGDLQNVVKQALLSKDGYAVAVYKFNAQFNGIYYYYDNSNTNINNGPRPFYVFAIGTRKIVSEFNDKVKNGEINSFKPVDKAIFGISDHEISIKESANQKDGYTKIVVNLKDFPDKLRSNCKILLKGISGTFEDVTDKANGNGLLEIDNKDLRDRGNEIKVEIENKMPNWCSSVNCDDDKIVNINNKTFNFKYLIEGIMEGVGEKTKYIETFEFKRYTVEEI